MQQTLRNDATAAAGVAKPVIFFDDVCVMCNGFVNFMLSIDRRQQFLFAPLGGEISRRILPPLPEAAQPMPQALPVKARSARRTCMARR